MKEKGFQRKMEDFVCENCGTATKGDGFTDHCSECLWSKHVDINPGDRKADCGGLMEPVRVKKEREKYFIYYQCQACDYEHRVKNADQDSIEEIIKIFSKNF